MVYLDRFDGSEWNQQAVIDSLGNVLLGDDVALSSDGNTLVATAPSRYGELERVVYVFRFDGTDWYQEVRIESSNSEIGDGVPNLALSADGSTLIVGAGSEDSNATGIDGDQSDNSAQWAGALYVFRYDGNSWSQVAYIKASNTEWGDHFGSNVALSSDGNTIAVAATGEDSSSVGINGDQSDNSTQDSAAVFVFRFDSTGWRQHAYVKATNTGRMDYFGGVNGLALSADGSTLVVGAVSEDSAATGINGDQSDNSAENAGAVYVY